MKYNGKGNILLLVNDTEGLKQFCPLVTVGWNLYSTRKIVSYFAEKRTVCSLVGAVDSCPQKLAGHSVPNSRIFAGIMADRDSLDDMNNIEDSGIIPFDVVVTDPINCFIRRLDRTQPFSLKGIDVSPSIYVLSAIQNARSVAVVTSMKDRETVIREIMKNGEVSAVTRSVLAENALTWLWSSTKFVQEVVHHHIGKGQQIFGEESSVA